MKTMRVIAFFIVLTFIAVIGVIGCVVAKRAYGHGWYDPACCSDQDCAPIPQGTKVEQVRNGWSITFPGAAEPVFFSDSAVKQSQDQYFHTCISPTSGAVFCLYVPAGV